MNKSLFYTLFICVFLLFSKQLLSQAHMDVSTKFFLNALKKEVPKRLTTDFITEYDITTFNDKYYVGALVKVNSMLSTSDLTSLGVIVSTQLNDLWTLRIPLDKVTELLSVEGIDFIEISSDLAPELDTSLASTRVDSVHQGLGGLDRAYFGSGVIIAVIDWGFDYTHPNFYDTTLTYMRLTRAWDQNKTQGTPPNGYSFGSEYVGASQLQAAQQDTLYVFGPGSHGTHVAGIAGGSGSGVINYGAAPDAELLLISLRRDAASLIDAFSYVTNYAASVNKPYVINMSFGSHLGPHDGSSLKNYGIDILNGPGKVFVGSAGNNGSNGFHLERDFTSTDDTLKTVVNFNNTIDDSFGQTLSMWGSANSSFSVSLMLVDNQNQTVYETPFYYSSEEPSLDEQMDFGGNELHIRMQSVSSHFLNNKPNIRMEVRNTTGYKTVLKVHSEDSHVHIWSNVRMNNRYTNWGVDLTSSYPGATAGNIAYGLGEPGGVGKNVITVGSYQAELILSGTNFLYGHLSGFTSRGPTVDGRTKPDVSSTGQNVLSSVNSFDETNATGFTAQTEFNGRTYGFKRFSGTSMSGPMVAGIVALMLESFPTMSATQAKQILKMTARLDTRTGDINPNEGTLDWGWGKANALAAILAAKTLSNIPDVKLVENNFVVYPNPSNTHVNIRFNEGASFSSPIELTVFSLEGRIVSEKELIPSAEMIVSTAEFPNGIYLFQFVVENSISITKVNVQH
jgi:minor extracellular serine protease Vpr